MTNCHYVPQFILRNFGDNIDVFNVKTQQYLQNRNPYSVFSAPDLYPDRLEKKFNEQMECDEARRLVNKVLTVDGDIRLTRDDIQHLKRFFLMGMIRCPDTLDYIHNFRIWLNQGEACMFYGLQLGDRFKDDLSDSESDYDYWIRSMDAVLDIHDFNTFSVLNHPKAT